MLLVLKFLPGPLLPTVLAQSSLQRQPRTDLNERQRRKHGAARAVRRVARRVRVVERVAAAPGRVARARDAQARKERQTHRSESPQAKMASEIEFREIRTPKNRVPENFLYTMP